MRKFTKSDPFPPTGTHFSGADPQRTWTKFYAPYFLLPFSLKKSIEGPLGAKKEKWIDMHVQLQTERAKFIWGFFTTLCFISCFLVIFRDDCLNQNQAGPSERSGGNNCLLISKLVPTARTPHYDRSRLASTAFCFLFVIWFFRSLWTWRSLCFCVKVVCT